MSETDNWPLAEKLFHGPQTRIGRWALVFAVSFVLFFVTMTGWGDRSDNLRAGFWADPLGAFLVISTALCGIACGLASAISIIRKHERSVLLFLTLIVGAFVCLFALGEFLEGL